MNFENKLISGLFVKRYKRFFIDVRLKNKVITAHCPNPGSMMGLLNKNSKVWITESLNLKRKLKYTLQIIKDRKSKVGVNTHITNKIVFEALQKNLIKDFKKGIKIINEKRFGLNTRFDFYLEDKKKKIFLEVKNVTLKRKNQVAEFPDSITSRGTKHLNELINAVKKGYDSYLLFVIQREDCNKFKIAKDIDIDYSKTLIKAVKNKVKILCYDCKFSSKGIKLNNKIKFHINE
ncbi:MAG: DNA/RNA nuclease SfsA [Pelagibacteraceae bacterium]|jgi:sugar fermentation stimulation protein A|nr:DNA/RNA nuclease SfsA [Pelagibacteraceae bacterium]